MALQAAQCAWFKLNSVHAACFCIASICIHTRKAACVATYLSLCNSAVELTNESHLGHTLAPSFSPGNLSVLVQRNASLIRPLSRRK